MFRYAFITLVVYNLRQMDKTKGLRNNIFGVNTKSGNKLAKEFNFDEITERFITDTFWPIIDVQTIKIESIKDLLCRLKNEFLNEYKFFDLKIFKREYLEVIEYEL